MSARVVPENALETALRTAAADPASRPDFYRVLLESMVFVIGTTAAPGQGTRLMQAGEKLAIQHWQTKDGKPVVPFFSSLHALQRTLKEESGYLRLPARELFTLTRGASLILDPMSEHGKDFYPDEVTALLETGVNHVPQTRVVEEAREILLGQPATHSADYPTALVEALARFLPRRPEVARAWLCEMHDPSVGEQPSLLVGLEGDGDLQAALREAGSVAAGTAPAGVPLDFIVVRAGEPGPSEYMTTSVAPFYERAPAATGLGARIRDWFKGY